MKQTAVEWLIHILKGQQDKPFNFEEWMIAMEHAKAMEKEQIFQAYSVGFSNGAASFYITPKDFYKNTFKHE